LTASFFATIVCPTLFMNFVCTPSANITERF
jgi:hypothetical protein